MSQKNVVFTGPVCRAENVIRELRRDTDQLYRLHKTKVSGKLDLKYCVITRPIEIWNCKFADEVDLRYCEFKQPVDFSGSTFCKTLNSGGEQGSHTVYKKDFICCEAVFEDNASFTGSYFEGSAVFSKAVFCDEERTIDFRLAVFKKMLQCNGATFEGPADFRGVQCEGLGQFRRVKLENGGRKLRWGRQG